MALAFDVRDDETEFQLWQYVAVKELPRQFDPASAHVLSRRRVRAFREHRCDASIDRGCGWHTIKPTEWYERVVLVDREHGTFVTYRACEWCRAGEARIEEWTP